MSNSRGSPLAATTGGSLLRAWRQVRRRGPQGRGDLAPGCFLCGRWSVVPEVREVVVNEVSRVCQMWKQEVKDTSGLGRGWPGKPECRARPGTNRTRRQTLGLSRASRLGSKRRRARVASPASRRRQTPRAAVPYPRSRSRLNRRQELLRTAETRPAKCDDRPTPPNRPVGVSWV